MTAAAAAPVGGCWRLAPVHAPLLAPLRRWTGCTARPPRRPGNHRRTAGRPPQMAIGTGPGTKRPIAELPGADSLPGTGYRAPEELGSTSGAPAPFQRRRRRSGPYSTARHGRHVAAVTCDRRRAASQGRPSSRAARRPVTARCWGGARPTDRRTAADCPADRLAGWLDD